LDKKQVPKAQSKMELEEGEVPKVQALSSPSPAGATTTARRTRENESTDSSLSTTSRYSMKANGAVSKSQLVGKVVDGISRLPSSGMNFAVFSTSRKPAERRRSVPTGDDLIEERQQGKLCVRKDEFQFDCLKETVVPLLSSYKNELNALEMEREKRRKQWQHILEKRKSLEEGPQVEEAGLPVSPPGNKSRKLTDHLEQVEDEKTREDVDGEPGEQKESNSMEYSRMDESFKEFKEIRQRLLRMREDFAEPSSNEQSVPVSGTQESQSTKFSVDIFSDSPVKDSSKEFLEPRRLTSERAADDTADVEGYCKLLPGDRLDNDRFVIFVVYIFRGYR